MRRARPWHLRFAATTLLATGWLSTGCTEGTGPGEEPEWPPLERTVTVEVWNGGGVPGAARDVALRLRTGGLDVVNWENAPSAWRDTTPGPVRILVRGGDTVGTGRIAEVLGATEVIEAPDPTRLVDLTVVVGRGGD